MFLEHPLLAGDYSAMRLKKPSARSSGEIQAGWPLTMFAWAQRGFRNLTSTPSSAQSRIRLTVPMLSAALDARYAYAPRHCY